MCANLAQARQLRINAYETHGQGISVYQIADAAQELGVVVAEALAN